MNKALLHKEVQEFLEKQYKGDLSKILLKGSPFEGISAQELGAQLTGKRKSEKKLPTWFKTRGIIYPPTLNLEQTSSEKTAEYKASLIKGSTLVDVTGGFGIDSYYFSKRFVRVIHCELNEQLSELAAHNFTVLNRQNIENCYGDGMQFLENSSEEYDWVYIDPSRRDDAGGRVFFLSDCLPNVPKNLEMLWKKTGNILLKTSPLLDITAGIRELEHIKEIHVVAVENDVKELLWVLKKDHSDAIKIKTINFSKNGDQKYEHKLGETPSIPLSEPLKYLYEPNAALMKSALHDHLAHDLHLFKLHPNTQLFTSAKLVVYPGRSFEILESVPFKKKKIRTALKTEKAHITTRNFPESVATLRKQLKLKDGGETYLFFITAFNQEKMVLVCRKA